MHSSALVVSVVLMAGLEEDEQSVEDQLDMAGNPPSSGEHGEEGK
jgi:hypothetical protein